MLIELLTDWKGYMTGEEVEVTEEIGIALITSNMAINIDKKKGTKVTTQDKMLLLPLKRATLDSIRKRKEIFQKQIEELEAKEKIVKDEIAQLELELYSGEKTIESPPKDKMLKKREPIRTKEVRNYV